MIIRLSIFILLGRSAFILLDCSFSHPGHPPTTSLPARSITTRSHSFLILLSALQQLPSSSLLATSLYPLLTLGIAGGAVSGELGAAAWNAFQQSQLAQAQAQAQNDMGQSSSSHMNQGSSSHMGQGSSHMGSSSSHMGSNPPSHIGLGGHSHSSYLSQASGMLNSQQPMSTLSSSLESGLGRMDSSSGLGRMDSSRLDPLQRMESPSGLPHSMDTMRTSSPRYSTGSSPSGLGASSSFGSPRFESGHFDARFESRFDSTSADANASSRFDAPSQFDSPQYGTGTNTSTPPGFGSSSSTPPGTGATGSGRRSSSSSVGRKDDGQ